MRILLVTLIATLVFGCSPSPPDAVSYCIADPVNTLEEWSNHPDSKDFRTAMHFSKTGTEKFFVNLRTYWKDLSANKLRKMFNNQDVEILPSDASTDQCIRILEERFYEKLEHDAYRIASLYSSDSVRLETHVEGEKIVVQYFGNVPHTPPFSDTPLTLEFYPTMTQEEVFASIDWQKAMNFDFDSAQTALAEKLPATNDELSEVLGYDPEALDLSSELDADQPASKTKLKSRYTPMLLNPVSPQLVFVDASDTSGAIQELVSLMNPEMRPRVKLAWGKYPENLQHINSSQDSFFVIYILDKFIHAHWYEELNSSHILSAQVGYDFDRPVVDFVFDEFATPYWELITYDAYERGKRAVAMTIDDQVISAPFVISGPIQNGRSQISLGSGDNDKLLEEAKDLALLLNLNLGLDYEFTPIENLDRE